MRCSLKSYGLSCHLVVDATSRPPDCILFQDQTVHHGRRGEPVPLNSPPSIMKWFETDGENKVMHMYSRRNNENNEVRRGAGELMMMKLTRRDPVEHVLPSTRESSRIPQQEYTIIAAPFSRGLLKIGERPRLSSNVCAWNESQYHWTALLDRPSQLSPTRLDILLAAHIPIPMAFGT